MKIASVRAWPISRRVREEFAIVSAAGAHPVSHFVFVEIVSDEGTSGFGEASVTPVWSGENQAGALAVLKDILSPALIGKDPFDAGAIAEAMDCALIGNPFAKAAVEMALLDLTGKALGVHSSVLLGGRRREGAIPLKFSIGAFPPDRAAQVVRAATGLGLRAAKIKVGFDVRSDLERVRAVRSEAGDAFPLAVDANGGWSEAQARAAIPELERLNIIALEQPLRRGDFRGCARLRQRTRIPLMLDESVFTRADALEAVRLDACDMISIYPGKNGGIRAALEIAQIAAAAGLECVIGSNLEMDLGSAAMLTLAAAAPALSISVGHDIIGPLYYAEATSSNPIQYRDGRAIVPSGPGLGVIPVPPA